MFDESIRKDLPQITDEQIKIINFWQIRGYDIINHTLGLNISLSKQPRYEHLGLDLQYLEQFRDVCINEERKRLCKEIQRISNLPITKREKFEQLDLLFDELKSGDEING